MSWEAAVAELRQRVEALHRELRTVTTAGTAEFAELVKDSQRRVQQVLKATNAPTSLAIGLDQALRLHCENAALCMEITALELCLGDAAAAKGTSDLDELNRFAAGGMDGAASYHDPQVTNSEWHDEDGGDAVSPDSTPSRVPRRPAAAFSPGAARGHSPPSGAMTVNPQVVKSILYSLSEIEQWWRDHGEALNRATKQTLRPATTCGTQTDDFVDFHALSQSAFPSSSDFEVTAEVRHVVALSSASQKRVTAVFDKGTRFDTEVFRELRDLLKRVTEARGDLPQKHQAQRTDAFADAIERYTLGLEPDPHSSFRKARGDKIIKEVFAALPDVRLFTCHGLMALKSDAAGDWGQIEITSRSFSFYPTGIDEPLLDETTLRQIAPKVTIPIEHIGYCAPYLSEPSSMAPPRLPLREVIKAMLGNEKPRAPSRIFDQLVPMNLYGRNTILLATHDSQPEDVRRPFIIATPEDANTLRLWCAARMAPSLYSTVFPSLKVPSCWCRAITPLQRRNFRQEITQGPPVKGAQCLSMVPGGFSQKMWPVNQRELTMCGTYGIGVPTYVAMRDTLLRDPCRQWFTVLDVAARLAQPFGEIDWATATSIALDFCAAGEATAVQLIEVLPAEV